MTNWILKFASTWNIERTLGAVLNKRTRNLQNGVAHQSGLRLGKYGNNTAGRMIRGQTRGDR